MQILNLQKATTYTRLVLLDNLTFKLAWKALQEIIKLHGVEGFFTGLLRESLQLGYKVGFLNDSAVWLLMLKKRNTSVHIIQ